jgi:hypothetical protein
MINPDWRISMSDLDDLLKYDPLHEAEKITGIHYKDGGDGLDNPTIGIGLLLAQQNAKAKNAHLEELGDTTFSNKLARYQSIITAFGFEKVLADEWESRNGTETFFIYAHRKGLLLSFDTFNGSSVNGGKVLYNWRPSVPLDEIYGCTSSGGFANYDTDPVWVGDHDCREALIHNLNKLNNRGEFVTPWVKRPFLWLLHYDESKVPGYDYRAISEARVGRLPDWVQAFIGPSTDQS